MGISRFGKRYDERIAAAKAAEDAERERIVRMTPQELAAERVTEAARDWEMTEKVGESLVNSIKVGLKEVERKKKAERVAAQTSSNGWFEANGSSMFGDWAATCVVKPKFEFDRWGYSIHVTAVNCYGLKDYFFGEDVLMRNSTSTKDYEAWMLGACTAMHVLVGDPWFERVAAERNAPGNFAPTVRPESVDVALLQMQTLGIYVDGLDEVREDDEARAIASIMRTPVEPAE